MLFGTFYECDRQIIERNCKRMKLFRVVIADDDKLVLKDLKNMLRSGSRICLKLTSSTKWYFIGLIQTNIQDLPTMA